MATQSRMIELGAAAPDFALTDPSGGVWALGKVAGEKPVLVAFICNHCPYVLHIAEAFSAFAREYQDKGLAIVAINANDIASHPEDAPDKMGEFAREHDFRLSLSLRPNAGDSARLWCGLYAGYLSVRCAKEIGLSRPVR